MHPWKNIIKGNTGELETKACFTCLERIPCSDDRIELKLHLFNFHSAKGSLQEKNSCHKTGGGVLEGNHVTKNIISKSFLSHIKHFLRLLFLGGMAVWGGLKPRLINYLLLGAQA